MIKKLVNVVKFFLDSEPDKTDSSKLACKMHDQKDKSKLYNIYENCRSGARSHNKGDRAEISSKGKKSLRSCTGQEKSEIEKQHSEIKDNQSLKLAFDSKHEAETQVKINKVNEKVDEKTDKPVVIKAAIEKDKLNIKRHASLSNKQESNQQSIFSAPTNHKHIKQEYEQVWKKLLAMWFWVKTKKLIGLWYSRGYLMTRLQCVSNLMQCVFKFWRFVVALPLRNNLFELSQV